MNNQLPPIDDFIDDEITEADFKVALTRLHAYLTEAVGANGENVSAAITINNAGSGNAVTAVSANGSAITVTKGNSFVPATRTIAGKALSSDITLSAADISDFSSVIMGRDNGSLQVGSLVLAQYKVIGGFNADLHNNGTTVSGSNLYPVRCGTSVTTFSPGSPNRIDDFSCGSNPLSGTWRNVSGLQIGYTNDRYVWGGLFQRIA